VRLLHAVVPKSETAHATAKSVRIRGVHNLEVMMPDGVGEVVLE
jgi:hypothetical protein